MVCLFCEGKPSIKLVNVSISKTVDENEVKKYNAEITLCLDCYNTKSLRNF